MLVVFTLSIGRRRKEKSMVRVMLGFGLVMALAGCKGSETIPSSSSTDPTAEFNILTPDVDTGWPATSHDTGTTDTATDTGTDTATDTGTTDTADTGITDTADTGTDTGA